MARLRASRPNRNFPQYRAQDAEMTNYRYSSIPTTDQPEDALPSVLSERPRSRKRLPVLMLLLLALFAAVFLVLGSTGKSSKEEYCDHVRNGFQCRPDISHSWGQYSAYYSVPSDIDAAVPDGCGITFVQFLSRHGGRHPTAKKTVFYSNLVKKIKSSVSEFPGVYSFLNDYEYELGADDLTSVGIQQMINSGAKFFQQYQHLASTTVPFIRAAGQERVVDSADNWTKGFDAELRKSGGKSEVYPYPILIIPEDGKWNNTLNHGQCPAYENGPVRQIASDAVEKWRTIFLPSIRERLQTDLKGLDLSLLETHLLMDLCPFETIAHPRGALSPFCDLFSPDEWRNYDYSASIAKWYGPGPGNPLGPTQGVGFVNELISRMTGKPVEDTTNTNRTLDSDPNTFPLDRSIYADFSHDNDMLNVFGALGLFDRTNDLHNETMDSASALKGYSASLAVPFAARVSFEKMQCDGNSEELVRVLLNDRVVPLQSCKADKLGRCALGAFVESLRFARNGGKWDECYDEL